MYINFSRKKKVCAIQLEVLLLLQLHMPATCPLPWYSFFFSLLRLLSGATMFATYCPCVGETFIAPTRSGNEHTARKWLLPKAVQVVYIPKHSLFTTIMANGVSVLSRFGLPTGCNAMIQHMSIGWTCRRISFGSELFNSF